jgi:hypothetical protein
MIALPPPSWQLADEEGKPTHPWYNYLKDADATWRPLVVVLTSESTVGNPAAHVLANHGLTHFSHVGAITTDWVLERPINGVRKTISISGPSTTLVITLPSTDVLFRDALNSSGWKLTFPTTVSFKIIDLIGIPDNRYYFVSNPGGAVATTV